MSNQPALWNLSGQMFELLELRDTIAEKLREAGSLATSPTTNDPTMAIALVDQYTAELNAIETGIRDFVAAKLKEVDELRDPLIALDTGVAICKAATAREMNRAMVLQNKHDRLKDTIKQAMEYLEQSGYWKPKQSKKVESARGWMRLQGNGGNQPVEITDEALVPDEYCRKTLTLSVFLLNDVLNALPSDIIKRLANEAKESKREASKTAIAEALAQNCAHCDGNGVVEAWGEPDEDADYRAGENPCKECGGTGKRGVPGARLAPRGSSLVISK